MVLSTYCFLLAEECGSRWFPPAAGSSYVTTLHDHRPHLDPQPSWWLTAQALGSDQLVFKSLLLVQLRAVNLTKAQFPLPGGRINVSKVYESLQELVLNKHFLNFNCSYF